MELKIIIQKINRNIIIKENGCWETKIGSLSDTGYIKVVYKGERIGIHRLSAAYYLGLDLTNKEELALHKNECNNKKCWNPEHLYKGSQKDNIKDSNQLHKSFGLRMADKVATKTHCKWGHLLKGKNVNGQRYCMECDRIKQKKRRDDAKRRKLHINV